MKIWWREFLQLNKRERRGTLALCVILLAEILIMSFRQHQTPEATADFAAFEDQVNAFLQKDPLDLAADGFVVDTLPALSYFPFNPNQLSIEDWGRLGLSAKQAQSIHNYEAAGGSFRKKEDLARMYVIDSALYAQLEPWIEIPDSMGRNGMSYANQSYRPEPFSDEVERSYDSSWAKSPREPEIPISIDMNLADSAGWKLLRGIGPAYARRIVRYREMLGGFVRKEQLMEVYGFPPETYFALANQLTVDSTAVTKIDINQASVEELAHHPYLSWNVARSLIAYRSQHGPYASLADIQKSDLVDADLYAKIAAYLTISSHAEGAH